MDPQTSLNAEDAPAGPPLARLVLRVGITGHRPVRLNAHAVEGIRHALRELLESVQRGVGELPAGIRAAYSPEQPVLRVVSALAEGVDRIAAHEALAIGYELQSPLPFARDEYARDFDSETSRREFETLLGQATAVLELDGGYETAEAREDAYAALGQLLLRQCDLLIAVWDGEAPRGRGGTGSIVRQALAIGIPVAWIDAGAPGVVKLWDRSGAWRPFDGSALHDDILGVLRPPEEETPDAGPADLRPTYFAEKEPGFKPLSSLWAAFVQAATLRRPRTVSLRFDAFADHTARDWQSEPHGREAAAATQQEVESRLLEHAAWADQLARYYAGQYRSAFLLIYVLATAAVVWAIVELAYEQSDAWHKTRLIVTAATIVVIVALWAVGTSRRWHSRWIDYRLLAEFLRHQRYLALLGLAPKRARKADHQAFGDPGNSWIGWHVRAIARDLGLPNVAMSEAYLADTRHVLREGWVEGQREYHAATAARHERLERTMRVAGLVTFGAAFVASFVAFLPLLPLGDGAGIEGWHWLDLLEIVLPTIGGGIAAVRSQGELERLAKRSAAMAGGLAHVRDELDRLDIRAASGISRTLSDVADGAATAMIDEILDWRVVFEARPLELPG